MQGSFPQAAFFYQNHIAAQKVVELLDFGSLYKSVTLENYAKGNHIDDVIVELSDKTIFYQVKWSKDEQNSFTIHNLITASNDKGSKDKSLIRELAEGFNKLQDKVRSEVILFSSRKISSQKFPSQGLDKSLLEFINQIHLPFVNSDKYKRLMDLPNYTQFENVINKMIDASGLAIDEFDQFIKSLRFQLEQANLERQKERVIYKLDFLGIDRNLYETLLTAIVEWSISGKSITSNDVLERLGLSDRFLDSIQHNFRVDKKHFVGNSKLFSKIDNAIENLSGGFIFIEGPPGIGKSTFLSEYQENNSNVKFSYYCFIPNEIDLGNRRLEKETFLKSFCIGITNSFPNISFPEVYSQNYEDKLIKWLYRLSEEESKIVFVIDGLDHVDKKKEALEQPLTSYLDGNLPKNIFFILSSQYLEAISDEIQIQIEQDEGRHIKVERFSEGETQHFLELRGFHPNSNIVSLVHKKSEGIPLYLHYITTLLMDLSDNDYVHEKFLENLPSLENSKIDSYHEFLYKECKKDSLAIWILAILATRREFTSNETLFRLLQILNVQGDLIQIEEKLLKYKHLLKLADVHGYTIFHNSFREFVLKKQGNLIGKINNAVVEFYKTNPNNDETYRNFYRHLFEMERFQEIISDCNENWLERNWRSFRPFDEISSNLHLAWQATAKLLSIKEFIRIAFLEQKFGLITANFEFTQNYEQLNFLLNINKQEEAIRRIWNGEQIQSNSSDFYSFLIAYLKKYRIRLTPRIAEIGFTQFLKRASIGETSFRFESRALYEDWKILFSEIEKYKWQTTDEHNDKITTFTPEENASTNNSIKKKIIDSLALTEKYLELLDILENSANNPQIRTHSILRIIELLIKTTNLEEVESYLKRLDFNEIDCISFNNLTVLLAESNILSKIENYLESNCPPPKLFAGILETKPDYGIKKELLELYNNLRVYFLLNPNEIKVYKLKSQSFEILERSFFNATIDLAELWCKEIKKETNDREKSEALKRILLELNIDIKTRQNKLSEILYSGEHFLQTDVDKIHENIFSFVANHLSPPYIIEIVLHWLVLDKGSNGYKNHNSSLVFAEFLHKLNNPTLSEYIQKLLNWAENIARFDEETLRLLEGLTQCAEGYGFCGFENETERLWNELYFLACGVGERKDYQFNQAVDILGQTQKENSEKFLNRLKKLLTLVHQIRGAADGRSVARAIGSLIDISAEVSPALALELLHKENFVYQDEVIELLSKSLPKLPNINLKYLWAIIKTMSKWEDYRDYEEDTYPAMMNLFEASIVQNDSKLGEEVYNFVKRQLIIEKDTSARISEFASKALSNGFKVSSVEKDYEIFKEIWDLELEKKQKSNNSYLKEEKEVEFSLPTIEDLHKVSEEDFNAFQKIFDDIAYQYLLIDLKSDLKHAETELDDELTRLFNIHPELVNKKSRDWKVVFEKFQKDLLNLTYTGKQTYKVEVEKLFDKFLNEVFIDIQSQNWKNTVLKSWNYKQWLRRFSSRSLRNNYKFERQILEVYLPLLIEQSSLRNLKNWELVCKKYLDSYKLREVLLIVAGRISLIDKQHALQVLSDIWESSNDTFYSSSQKDIDSYVKLLLELDPNRAKSLILEGFIFQYKKYPQTLIYYLYKVLEYSEHFDEPDIYEISYEHYERYNEILVEGLSKVEVNYDWIKEFPLQQSFEFSTIKYLIRLFNYPEIEVRRLALLALFDLIKGDNSVIKIVIEICVTENENFKEHLLYLLYSVALWNYNLILPYKEQLFALVEDHHFNISQSVKEILLYCAEKEAILSNSEIFNLNLINTEPSITLPVIEEGALLKGRNFVPSKYQATILYNLQIRNKNGGDLTDKVYTKLHQNGWTSESGMERESQVRRSHNINTNFDNIEINGDYFQSNQKILNEVFAKEIKTQNYNDTDIQTLKQLFRLYDPSDLLTQQIQKPSYINWLGQELTDENFLSFEDVKEISIQFQARNKEWITLYEDGHQRSGDKFTSKSKRTVYYKVIAFLLDKSYFGKFNSEELTTFFYENLPVPYHKLENLYSHELPFSFFNGNTYPFEKVKPIVGFSENKFRGQGELSKATLLSDFVDELKLSYENDYSLNLVEDGIKVVEFSNWQESYDQDRRRQKPKSAGVLLNIKRDLIEEHLEQNNLSIAYFVEVERSADQYKEEKEMEWISFNKIFLQ